MRVVITGASGLLGSAVHRAFRASADKPEILALSHTRAGNGLTQLDLLDLAQAERVFSEFRPDWIIHCAAERKPDIAEKDMDGTAKLNADLPGRLAGIAQKLGATLVYISTDYVFDGTSAPYVPTAQTNPVNHYGRTKRDGENAVLDVEDAKVVVLRIPVLYGPAPKNTDSAVNLLLDVVQDQSGKEYKMDHYSTRFPTAVDDIGAFLVRLTTLPKNNPVPIPRVLHFSAHEAFTKYEMCRIFARVLGVSDAHIVPDASEPQAGTIRPKNTQLDTKETEVLLGGNLGCVKFEEWWTAHLAKK